MPDDKSQRGGPDRARVAEEEQYEVDYFARKHGLSTDEARNIIRRSGGSRRQADDIARRQKGRAA